MSRRSTLHQDEIRDQFHELGSLLDEPLTVYLIGGGALTLREMKDATKDIDLIVRDEAELERLRDVLEAAGYALPDDLANEYDQLEAAFILEKGPRRFDVFHRAVAGVLRLSEGMEERSERLFVVGPLEVRTVSLNDIFLFKSVANRDDDVDDMITLIQAGIDEEVITDEVTTQLSLIESDEFISSMRGKFERLEDRGYSLTIQDEIERLNSQVQAGHEVEQCIRDLRATEYHDDRLYEGIPKHRVRTLVGDETAKRGIKWLEQLNKLEYASDDTLVLCPE